MADTQKNVKVPKKEKKQKTEVKLPNARKSIKRQRAMSQGKADWNGWIELFTGIAVALLILFILFGGINQKKFVETAGDISKTIGNKIEKIFNPDDVIIEDGVYYDTDGDGNPG